MYLEMGMKNNMKVMLVNPKPHKDSYGLTDLMHCEPLNLEYIGTLVESLKHDVLLVDLQVDRKGLKHYLKSYNPDVVLFTSYLIHVNIVKGYSKEVKEYKKDIVTAVGGVQAEVTPELFVDDNIDYILGINGMENTEILLKALENGEKPVFNNEKINKDYQLPKVNRHFADRYRKKYYYSYRMPCTLLKTSFGCPFRCSFCFCTAITNYEYYTRELEPIMQELMEMEEENVFLIDDNFMVDKERLKAFCDLLDKYNIHKHYNYAARADYIVENEDMVELLAKHGFDTVFVGLESFKQEDLDDFNKKSSVETMEKAAQILAKHGVELHASAIVGLDWDKQDFKDFAKWLHTIKYRYINFMSICPLPGTDMWDKYKDKLLYGPDEWEKFDFMHVMVKPTKLKTSEFYKEIIKIYFRVTANFDNLFYITKTCNLKVAVMTVYGLLKIIFNYLRMSREYKKKGD